MKVGWIVAVACTALAGFFVFLYIDGDVSLAVPVVGLCFAAALGVLELSAWRRRRGQPRARRVRPSAREVVVSHRRATHVAMISAFALLALAGVVALSQRPNAVLTGIIVAGLIVAVPVAWSYLCAVWRRPCTVLSPAGVRVRGDIFDAELRWDELVAVRVEESPAGVRVVGVPGASSYSWRRVRGVVPLYGRPGEGSIFLYDFTYDRPGVVAEVMETLARLAPERRAEYLLGPAVALLRGDHETSQA
ncbi:hypothetical protein [Nocardioides limicola]|uniref:hypothetical protein n=1 Tax=Nocardioides limicola TaxID=2803368 RepID=UPI00193BC38F|nr:hypothetical protein [Nocardioides sp. DJM-14]